MIRRVIILFFLLPNLAIAEGFKGYRTTTLDAIVEERDGKTKDEGPGFSISKPEKIKFTAAMRGAAVPCGNGALVAVPKIMNFTELLKQVSVTHCVTFGSARGRSVAAFVQDTLVPGINTDVAVGRNVDIYADFLAYQVSGDRSRNTPILLINRFEPK
jgi:hypothetical protein